MLLAFSLSMLDCTTTSGEETEAEESIAERYSEAICGILLNIDI